MKFNQLIVSVFIVSVFLLASAKAADNTTTTGTLEFSVSPNYSVVEMGKTTYYNLSLTNNGNSTDSFRLYVLGTYYSEWTTIDKYLMEVRPGKTEVAVLAMTPINDIGDYDYVVVAESVSNPSIKISRPLSARSISPDGFLVRDVKTTRSGNELRIELSLKALESHPIEVLFEVLNNEGSIVKSTVVNTETDVYKIVSESVNLQDMEAGDYNYRVSVKNTSVVRTGSFSVNQYGDVAYSKKVEETLLYKDISILVTNNGNSDQFNYKIYDEAPKSSLITFTTKTTGSADVGNSIRYEFTIPKIKPAQTILVAYRIELWPIVVGYLAAGVIIIVVIVYSFLKLSKPQITKRYMRRDKGKYTIALEIRNSLLRKSSDVTVRDWTSPLVQLEKEFDLLKPVIKESYIGAEMIWKLGDLNRGEERVINYTVRSVVHGNLKMPQAQLLYKKGKNTGKVYSKSIEVITG